MLFIPSTDMDKTTKIVNGTVGGNGTSGLTFITKINAIEKHFHKDQHRVLVFTGLITDPPLRGNVVTSPKNSITGLIRLSNFHLINEAIIGKAISFIIDLSEAKYLVKLLPCMGSKLMYSTASSSSSVTRYFFQCYFKHLILSNEINSSGTREFFYKKKVSRFSTKFHNSFLILIFGSNDCVLVLQTVDKAHDDEKLCSLSSVRCHVRTVVAEKNYHQRQRNRVAL